MNRARSAVYEGPHQLVIKEYPLPEIGEEDMLVEVEIAGVDGSEVHMFRGEIEAINALAPVLFGDEIIGRVVQIGEAASRTRQLKEGDRVVVEARWPCYACRPCREGNYYLCDRRDEKGGYGWIRCDEPPHLWGGYSTHVYVPPEALVYRIPEQLPATTALVASSVLANSIYWTGKAGVGLGGTVVILGPGPQGIGCSILAGLRGADVLLVGLSRDRGRLDCAERLSSAGTVAFDEEASTRDVVQTIRHALGGREVAVVLETAGAQASKDLAAALVRRGGTIANCSVPARPLSVDFTQLLLSQVTMISPLGHPHTVEQSLNLGIKLLEAGRDIGEMVTHTFPIEEAELAVRTAGYETSEAPIKVAIRPNG